MKGGIETQGEEDRVSDGDRESAVLKTPLPKTERKIAAKRYALP